MVGGLRRDFGGHCSHMKALSSASTISSSRAVRRAKDMGALQSAHLGQGLYISAPCAYRGRTERHIQLTITFDPSYSSCSASVAYGRESGRAVTFTGLNGKTYTMEGKPSVSTVSCSIRQGNPFA
jgi:hypothetical protein